MAQHAFFHSLSFGFPPFTVDAQAGNPLSDDTLSELCWFIVRCGKAFSKKKPEAVND